MSSAERVPAQYLIRQGGAITAPGYDHHSLVGATGFSQRAEWHTPVPFFRIPLGKYGRSPAAATLAPWVNVALVGDPWSGDGIARSGGAYPSVGVGTIFFFDFVRVDVARGLRAGRWSFSVDVMREFWGVL
jgi:hypothetical protein